jgi:hypothetical protein
VVAIGFSRSECVGYENGQFFPMQRVEGVIMEMFISSFLWKNLEFPAIL